ncbi:MAG TPA: hypothetical protein PLI09_11635 [Candidatus Hydrogenedentes bacterium]|nr:hypothetical protein [Candidatus Hydrogenedentota bacterium]
MNERLQKAREQFLMNPLLNARAISESCGLAPDEIRSVFVQIQNDAVIQKRLDSWGPGCGYCIRVMSDVLQASECIQAIYNHQPVYPSVLELHTGPLCPCACIFCYSKGEATLNTDCSRYCPGAGAQKLTSAQILSAVFAFVDHGCKAIYFSGGLEPFSSKTTVDVFRHLPAEPCVRVYTNGVPDILTHDVLEMVVARASQLRFSIHAATPQTYAVVQMPHRSDGQQIFEEVKRRVKEALQIRRHLLDAGKPAAQIGVTFLTVPANYQEIEQAVMMWAEAGLDFFDIGNDALANDSRTNPLTPQQRDQLHESFQRLNVFSESGKLGNMRLRPSRESVQKFLKPDAGICYAPLLKAVIDPFGTRWACCMRAHPALQHGKFRVNHVTSGEDITRFAEQHAAAPQTLQEIPLPWHCRECTEFEYAANICMKKILDDLAFGIKLSEQPFASNARTSAQQSVFQTERPAIGVSTMGRQHEELLR